MNHNYTIWRCLLPIRVHISSKHPVPHILIALAMAGLHWMYYREIVILNSISLTTGTEKKKILRFIWDKKEEKTSYLHSIHEDVRVVFIFPIYCRAEWIPRIPTFILTSFPTQATRTKLCFTIVDNFLILSTYVHTSNTYVCM